MHCWKPELIKSIFLLLLLFFNNYCFSQSDIDDSLIIKKYSAVVSESNFYKKQPNIYLIKIKENNTSLFKEQYKEEILRQFNAYWFVIKNVNTSVQAQNLFQTVLPANNNYKLSASFNNKNSVNDSGYRFIIKVADSNLLIKNYNQLHIEAHYHSNYFIIKAKFSFITDTLIKDDNIQSIDIMPQAPKQENVINDYDNTENAISLFFSQHPSINGNGLTASVKENLFDTNDIDFKRRYVASSISSDTVSSHATTMATLIAGGSNSFQTGKGIAWGAELSSSDFANLLPDAYDYFNQCKISVQNNSYGVGIENFYGNDAAAYDQSTIDNPYLLYVFSAGNSGNVTPGDGMFKNINGFANLTGSFKQAKNILTVGSVDSFYNVPLLSSKGPAFDGRIKPELVAYGNDGSSGAAAITSGTVLAVQSAYKSVHHDSLPANALAKAIIINSADDVFKAGPDFYSGYGNVNTSNAVNDALANQYYRGDVKRDETLNFPVHITNNISNIKFTLVWNDPVAQPNAFTSLINDLDLTVENASDHTIFQPWVLNSDADSSTLLNTATRKRDSLNNVEQVTISNPAEGDYIIHVKAYNLATTSQSFYIAYRFDTANTFTFISPVSKTHFTAGGNTIFRWKTTFTSTTKTKLEYSIDKGNTWQLISNAVNLSKKYFKWVAPDTNVVALARIIIGNTIFYSDTFDISKQIFPHVGFYCGDSSLIYWNKQIGVQQYQVYNLGDKYLQPLTIISDTSYIIKNSDLQYVSVAAFFNGRAGINSYTFNLSTQGVSCYISNFLADISGSIAALKLFLGTTFNVQGVRFQKFVSGSWKNVKQADLINSLNINAIDSLQQGINYYRAVVMLDNGEIITSNEATVYYFKNADYIIAPNPSIHGQGFYVLSNDVSSNAITLFDEIGRKFISQKIEAQHQFIATAQLSKGIYFIAIFNDDNKLVYKTKIIIN